MSIVPSLETCKRLRDAGWNMPTIFFYEKREDIELNVSPSCESVDWNNYYPRLVRTLYSAPTLEEILSELDLPRLIMQEDKTWTIDCKYPRKVINNTSAVEAACELWITLRKEK